jgi:anaerobic selenocysteine-containing dehydrogenase
VQASKGVLHPLSKEMKSEVEIVCALAKMTLGNRSRIDWNKYVKDYDHIREDIEKVLPQVFINYNENLRIPGGFYLPNPNRERKFSTDNGKAKFHCSELEEIKLQPDELMMMTIRSHDQFNTTIYGLNDRYRGIHNERRIVFMNQKDMNDRGFAEREVVDLFNDFGGRQRSAHRFLAVAYPIPAGCCATYFPETNVLVPIESVAETSNTPTSKQVIVKIKKHV